MTLPYIHAIPKNSQSLQNYVDSELHKRGIPRPTDGDWNRVAEEVREKAADLSELAEWLEEAEKIYQSL